MSWYEGCLVKIPFLEKRIRTTISVDGLMQIPLPIMIVRKPKFVSVLSSTLQIPLIVAEELTDESLSVEPGVKRRPYTVEELIDLLWRTDGDDFIVEENITGHMSSAMFHRNSQAAMDDCNTYANMVPHQLENNGGIWLSIEREVLRTGVESVWSLVLTGTGMAPAGDSNVVAYRIQGKHRIAVPTDLWKLILYVTRDNLLKLKCWHVKNRAYERGTKEADVRCELDMIKSLTSFKYLFDGLPISP